MEDDTTQIKKTVSTDNTESKIFNVSVRGWLATVLVVTVCFSHLLVGLATAYNAITSKDFAKLGTLTTIGEPLYSMSVAALGFYFGTQRTTPPTKPVS